MRPVPVPARKRRIAVPVRAAALLGLLLAAPARGDAPPAAADAARPETPAALLPPTRNVLAELRSTLEAGRGLETVSHLHTVARIESEGSVIGRVETWARRDPPAMTEVLDLSGITQTAVLVEDTAWFRDPNGRVREATGDEAASYRLAHSLLFHTYVDGPPTGFSMDVSSTHIVFRPDGPGAPRSLELAKEGDAGLIPSRFLQRQQGTDLATTFSEWRPVQGILYPFRSVQSTGDERFDLTIVTREITFPEDLDEARFAIPTDGGASDARITDPALAAGIPVDRVGSLLLVDVRVNGRPAPFLLDTGAAATVLSQRLADALGLPARGLVEARGAGGSEPARFVDVDRLELPGAEVVGQTVVALPLDALRSALPVPVGGILGYDFLSRFAVEIDFPAGNLALSAAGHYEPRPGATRVPLRIEANVPRVEATLDDVHTGNFLLDLGNASPLVLHTAFAAEHGYLDRAGPGDRLTGIGGEEEMRSVTIGRVRLGGTAFENVRASIAVSARGVLALDESIGNLGSGLFGGSVVAFDYGAGSLWIAPATADSASAR